MMSSGIVESAGQSQQQQQERAAAVGAQRSRLVQRLLAGAPDLPAFINDMLTAQAVLVAGTEAAGFLLERRKSGGQGGQATEIELKVLAHVRPDNADAQTRNAALEAFAEIIQPCIEQNKDGAIEISDGSETSEAQYCLVTLLRDGGEIVAVSAVITRARDAERAQQRLVSMQLVAGYFDFWVLRRKSETALATAESHQHVLQLSGAVGTAQGFKPAASNLCNEVAARTGATRVSLGWVKGRHIKVVALSHTEDFDRKQEVVVLLEKVMEECGDQEEPVQFDPATPDNCTANITRYASQLSRQQAGATVLSLPLRRLDEIIGVLTLEFAAKSPLTPQVAQGIATSVELLGPQLYDRHANDRWLITKAGLSARDTAKMLLGPKHWLAKLITVSVAAVVVGVCVIHWPHRVAAPFQFIPVEKRVIAAPFNSYITEVGAVEGEKIRAGMFVPAGTVLVKLDVDDKHNEYVRAESEANAYRRQSAALLAEGKTADALIAAENARASRAEAELLARMIERATIVAPFDGQLLKSEVGDKRGAPVQQGDALFELAEDKRLRVEMTVHERDIQYVKVGQEGFIATSSLPGVKHKITVDRIVPIGKAKEGENVFTVYGTLDTSNIDEQTLASWRPGMAGEARLEGDDWPLIALWTDRLVNWVRLKLWL